MAEPENLAETYRVDIAALSEEGQEDVLEALADNPGMTADEAQALINDTAQADEKRDSFDALQKQQEEAMDQGDWATARDRAQEAEYEMREAAELGADADAEILEAETDVAEIDEAIDNRDGAQQNAEDAAEYAELGMDSAAQVHGQSAAEYADTAAENATAANPNEYNDDHDVDGDGSTYD